MDIVYFFGRFHVVVLHLPIGILMLAAGFEILVRHPRFRHLAPVISTLWLLGAIAGLVTVVLGYMHTTEGGFDGAGVSWHRWNGTALVLLAFIIWAWRHESPRSYAKGWPLAVMATIALLFSTGHLGGNITHGSTYLVQYAPGPLRVLAGLPVEFLPRPPVTDIATADIYLDVVAPTLRTHCGTCHNDDKRRGELSLATYKDILRGGESGPVLVAGDVNHSEMHRRISLPQGDVDFMPKDGKTPLTDPEIAAIAWWISVGAPKSGTLADLQAPDEIRAQISEAIAPRS